MSYIFEQIARRAVTAGIFHNGKKEAIKWFRKTASEITRVSAPKMMETAGPFKNVGKISPESIGKMYCFFYDPKWKKELKHYDTFPLVFPIEYYNDGFLGINLHYLPPYARAQLMDALYARMNNKKWDKTTKLQITYAFLKKYQRYKLFRPCIHRYLWSHVKGNFMNISPKEWDMALFLPTERFKKESKEQVWANSMRKMQ